MGGQVLCQCKLPRNSRRLRSGKFIFIISTAQCSNYKAKLIEITPPSFDPAFIETVKQLPTECKFKSIENLFTANYFGKEGGILNYQQIYTRLQIINILYT